MAQIFMVNIYRRSYKYKQPNRSNYPKALPRDYQIITINNTNIIFVK
jgi:hypothetical protein